MGEVVKDLKNYDPDMGGSWLKFEEGTTTLRLLSHSYTYRTHWDNKEKKSYDCEGEGCKWCAKGNQPRNRWAYLVLVRDKKAPAIKVMEVGWSVFGTILELANDEDYGDPREYDIKVTRKGSGLDTEYTVIPGKDKKFNKKEEVLTKDLDIDKATNRLLGFYKENSGMSDDDIEEALGDAIE